jgi:UDPglucose--hexose-1-phosphate uridylyltransferase
MGCSNPHPHGQVWSLSEIPSYPAAELENLKKYSQASEAMVIESNSPRGPGNRPCLLCEYATYELSVKEGEGRVIFFNEHWVALVPYWAVWPFELLGASSRLACLSGT